MKNILIALMLIWSASGFGQDGLAGVYGGEVAGYLKKNFTLSLNKDANPDSVLTIHAGNITYSPVADLTYGPYAYFMYDTTTYFTGALAQGSSTHAVQNGALRAWPVWIPRTMTIDKIAVEVTTVQAGGKVVFGIWNDNGSFYPGTRVMTTQEFVCDNLGVLTQQITPITLIGHRFYFIGESATQGGTFRGLGILQLANVLGYATGANGTYTCYTVARSYNSAVPDPFTTGATKLINTTYPILFMQEQ